MQYGDDDQLHVVAYGAQAIRELNQNTFLRN